MKKLIHISPKIWIAIGVLFCIILVFLFFMLQYKIETTIKTHVSVKTDSSSSIFVNSDIGYKIRFNDKITLKIGDNYYEAFIDKIEYNVKLKLFEVKMSGLNQYLIPNSIVEATIIRGTHSIASFLVGV